MRSVSMVGVVAALGALSLGALGCTTALSGPLRTVPLETAATLEPERASVGIAGGLHHGWIGHVSGQARVGLAPGLDLGFEGSWITFGDPGNASSYGVGHLDVRHRVDTHVAFTGGLSMGHGSDGLYAGPDLGVVLAYESWDVVPFFALRVALSVPLVATPRNPMLRGPITTLYLQPAAGLRAPVILDAEGRRLDLAIAAAFTAGALLEDGGSFAGLFGGQAGVTLVL